MGRMWHYIDLGSFIIMTITFVLFVAALFTKGLTHDLFLEVGVFLISVKLILLVHRNNVATENLMKNLNEVKILLRGKNDDCGTD